MSTYYLAYVNGSVKSYVRAGANRFADVPGGNPGRGLEFTESLADARRFASQAAITTFLAGYTYTLPVMGGTGTIALTVSEP